MAARLKVSPHKIGIYSLAAVLTLLYGWVIVAGTGAFSGWTVGADSSGVPAERSIQFVTLWLLGAVALMILSWRMLTKVRYEIIKPIRIYLLSGAVITAFAGCLVLVLITVQPSLQTNLGPDMSSTMKVFPTVNVDDLYASTNAERAGAGMTPLTRSAVLEQSACLKVDDMIMKDYWSHNSPNGTTPWYFFETVGYVYKKAGENLAYGYPDGAHVVRGWMGSQAHRDNLLGDYREVGYCSKVAAKFQGGKNNVIVGHYGRQ